MTPSMHDHAARQAALTLHGLQPEDRAWVLDALPPQQRTALEPLLRELEELGIPGDVGISAEAEQSVSPRREAANMEAPNRGTLRSQAATLRKEPPKFTAAFLSRQPPGRQQQLLTVLGPAYAEQVQRCEHEAAHPALDAAVLQVVGNHLAACSAASREPTLRHWVRSLFPERHT
jgi:hypothetical protein